MNGTDLVTLILEIITGGVFLGLIGALCGRARGNPGGGFWWGFFLGPIGWLIVLLDADLRPKCPECRGVIEPGAARCKNCGVELVYENAEANISSAPSIFAQEATLGRPKVPRLRLTPKIHHPTPRIRSA